MLDIHVVSDSTGETANQLVDSIMIQFPELKTNTFRHSNIMSKKDVDYLISTIGENSVIIMTVVLFDIQEYIKKKAESEKIAVIDLIGGPLREIEELTGKKALRKPGLIRDLDSNYFSKIASIEFAIKYDDGKDLRGFEKADIVLVGVSRTSKTPLSMFLANKNYKVANLPLVPEVGIPEEIYKVDKDKIIGLVIDPKKLNEIRNERLKLLGLSPDASYATQDRIEEELAYANKLFKELDCAVLDVTGSTIEESATKILEIIEA